MLTEFGICRQIFIEVSNIKFHVNASSGRSADIRERTDGLTNSLIPFQSNKECLWLFKCGRQQ